MPKAVERDTVIQPIGGESPQEVDLSSASRSVVLCESVESDPAREWSRVKPQALTKRARVSDGTTEGCLGGVRGKANEPLVRVGVWGNSLVRASQARESQEQEADRPRERAETLKERRGLENQRCLGGLRAPWSAVRRAPLLRHTGAKVRVAIEDFLTRHPEVISLILESRGEGWAAVDAEFGVELVECIMSALGAVSAARGEKSRWRPGLVKAFVKLACDPDTDLATWLEDGAPTGVMCPIEPKGVFPRVESTGEAVSELEEFYATAAATSNYASVEENREAVEQEVQRLSRMGFVTLYHSWAEVLGRFGSVVVSKMAAVTKVREDGTTKLRIIIDMLRSGVNRFVKLQERIVLPRLVDAVDDLMELFGGPSLGDAQVDQMVLDWADAFHSMGVREEEFPQQVVKGFGDGYIGYETVLFGGAGSPLVWGRAAAFLSRSGQSLFDDWEARIETYVDDPWTAWCGDAQTRRKNKVILLLWWLAVGPDISWKKVSIGAQVQWIGACIKISGPGEVTLTLPESFVEDLARETHDLLQTKTIPVQRLRKLAGKAAWAAGFIPYLRSMIAPLWAAIREVTALSKQSVQAKSHDARRPARVPTARVTHALRWLRAFALRRRGALARSFRVAQHKQPYSAQLIFDGSPWGYGGVLVLHGHVLSWFAVPISVEDMQRFGIEVGNSKYQALIECLAILIGLRAWLAHWVDERTVMCVKSDSSAALGATLKLCSPVPAINTVVREIALDLAEGKYRIDFHEHIAGSLNVWADALSRLHQPGGGHVVPPELMQRPRAIPLVRNAGWWETAESLVAPVGSSLLSS